MFFSAPLNYGLVALVQQLETETDDPAVGLRGGAGLGHDLPHPHGIADSESAR